MTKSWQERVVNNCEKIIINPIILEHTSEISEASRINPGAEQGGYIRGIVDNGIFYGTSMVVNTYGNWHKMRLRDDFGYSKSFNIEADRLNLPFQALPFHSHPGENLVHRASFPGHWRYKGDTHFEAVKTAVAEGVFGNRSVVEVMNEDARELSMDDIDHMPGDTQLLISPTYKSQNPFSHLQAFRITSDKQFDFVREVTGKLPISLANYNNATANKIAKMENQVNQAVTARYKSCKKKLYLI